MNDFQQCYLLLVVSKQLEKRSTNFNEVLGDETFLFWTKNGREMDSFDLKISISYFGLKNKEEQNVLICIEMNIET